LAWDCIWPYGITVRSFPRYSMETFPSFASKTSTWAFLSV
jgi:hypothetical protein